MILLIIYKKNDFFVKKLTNMSKIRIQENQTGLSRIAWDDIARVKNSTKPKFYCYEIYRLLTDEEKLEHPGKSVITDFVPAEILTYKDFNLIHSILRKKYNMSPYPQFKISNYVDVDSILIYVQLVNISSYSIIFNLSNRFTNYSDYNDLDDTLEGSIYIEDDISKIRYDQPEYYKDVEKKNIIQDLVKWIEECLIEFQK